MKCLTVWRPWDYALLHGKTVENRIWRPPAALIGQRFALHAGQKYDHSGAETLKELLKLAELPECTAGVVFATTRLVGWVERDDDGNTSVSDAKCRPALRSKWFGGPVGWVLEDTRALARPVACPGFQKLWVLPAKVEARVLAQLDAAA